MIRLRRASPNIALQPPAPLEFSYSGSSTVADRAVGSETWRFMKLTTSGTLTRVAGAAMVDVLHLGGGGAGGRGLSGGGSAGQLRGYQGGDELQVAVTLSDTTFSVTIGAGAARQTTSATDGLAGGATTAFGRTANGGAGGSRNSANPGTAPGGGAAPGSSTGVNQVGGTADTPVGYAGGNAFGHATSSLRAGGGGAGTAAAGGNAASQNAGEGGAATDLGAWLGTGSDWVGEGGGGFQTPTPSTAAAHGGGTGGNATDQAIDATSPGSGGGGSNLSYGSAGFRGELHLKWRIA